MAEEIIDEIAGLIASSDDGRIMKEGINTVIVGKPNAGKSSLLNALLGEERAIVTDIAGTTRDVLQESINLQGVSLNIMDTAGIRETSDIVEKIGVDKAKSSVEDADLIIYVIGLSTMTLLGNITIWPLLKKYICKIYLNELNPLCHFKEMLQLFVPTIAIQVYTVLDKTMIGLFCDDSAENGYYEQSEKIVKMVLTVITSLSAVMVPRISSTFAKGDNDSVKSYMYKSYRFVWFLGLPMVTGLICVSDYFVPWFLGEGFDKASLLIKLLSFLILAIGLNTITGQQFLISTKRQNFYTVSVCIGAAVNVILNLILIPHFFSIGAALGTLAAETIICIVQFIYVSYWKYYSVMKIMCMSVKYIVASLIMGICITALKWIVSQDIIGTFILIVSGVAVYTALLVVFRDDLLMSAIKGIFKKIKHRA